MTVQTLELVAHPGGVPGAGDGAVLPAVQHRAPRGPRRCASRGRRRSVASAPCGSECLDHALQVGEAHGIWGGLNEHERRGMLEASYS